MAAPSTSLPPSNTLVGRVLLLENDLVVLSDIRRSLAAHGHDVVARSDPEAALQELERGGVDLVICARHVPGMDGLALLQVVHLLDPDLPVVLLAQDANLSSAVRAVAQGALRYLSKPVKLAELHGVVQEGLHARSAARQQRLLSAVPSPSSTALDEAIALMWMAYQPIVRAIDGKVFAHEALLRSRSQTLSNPAAVLDAAEELGRTPQVGRRVRQLVSGLLEERSSEYVFVNMHASELLDESLYSPEAPLSRLARRVVLEITERAALDDVDDVKGRTRRLRELGFGLAVDDLGAGYAGLNSFAQIAPDFVKLDMSLVRDVHRDSVKRKLIRGVAAMCKDMGVTLVAEGVESNDERATLVELGCDLLQGFLLGRPSANLHEGT